MDTKQVKDILYIVIPKSGEDLFVLRLGLIVGSLTLASYVAFVPMRRSEPTISC